MGQCSWEWGTESIGKGPDGIDPPSTALGDARAEIDLDETAFDDRSPCEVEFILGT